MYLFFFSFVLQKGTKQILTWHYMFYGWLPQDTQYPVYKLILISQVKVCTE